MADGTYKLVKENSSGYFDEKGVLAESGKTLGFDASLNPVMIAAGGGLIIQSAIVIETTDDAKENGAALIAAYTAAKALLPNGAALSATNRACVIVPPAKYDLDHVDAPAPTGITITPDAVGSNPVTWYYRAIYGIPDSSSRGLITEESSFTVGDSTTSIIVDGGTIPDWAEVLSIMLGTVQGGIKEYGIFPFITSFPTDIFGMIVNPGYGDLYVIALLPPVHQDFVPLTLDTEFVDIIGLTTDRSLQHIYGTPPATNSGVIVQREEQVPAPTNISITPDAVGTNPVTWYYKVAQLNQSNEVTELSEELSYQQGDSTTELIFNCTHINYDTVDFFIIIKGTTSGVYTNIVVVSFTPPSTMIPIADTQLPFDILTGVDLAAGVETINLMLASLVPLTTNCSDVHISNLTVEILTEVAYDEGEERYLYNYDNTDSSAYFPSTNLSNTVVNNCNFIGTESESGLLWSMRIGVEYSGTFTSCIGGDYAFGGSGTASGTFTNCTGGNYAFGGNIGGTASGTFTNCTGGAYAFGAGGIASGTFNYCTGGTDSFGSSGVASGTFNYCTGGNYAFGGNIGGIASGTFSFCKGGEFPFAEQTPTASVATIALVAGGTGYPADDELTVVGGTGTAATIKVLTVNAGVIETAEILTVGSYTAEPTNAVAVTGGTGNNDATFNLTWNEGHIYGCVDSTGFIAELNWDD